MKKLITAICLIGASALAQIPVKLNSVTSDVSKIKGNFDTFRWDWLGYNTQSNSFTIKNGSSFVTLDGLQLGYKMSRNTATGVVTYIAVVGATTTGSNYTFTIANTNVPPNGAYLFEVFAYTSTTNLTTTLAQGKINVAQSLYQEGDSQFPWPDTANLTAYLTIASAATNYYPLSNPSNFVTAAITNGLYPSSNPSNFVASADSTYTATVAKAQSATQPADLSGYVATNNATYTNAVALAGTALQSVPANDDTTTNFTQTVITFTGGGFLDLGSQQINNISHLYGGALGTGYHVDMTQGLLEDSGAGPRVWRMANTATNGDEIVNYQTATNLIATLAPVYTPVANDTTTTNMTQAVTVPTQVAGTSNSVIANTEYVDRAVAGVPAAVFTNLFAGSGTTGSVTSAAGDAGKYLKADGTWATVSAGGGTVTNMMDWISAGAIYHASGAPIARTNNAINSTSEDWYGFDKDSSKYSDYYTFCPRANWNGLFAYEYDTYTDGTTNLTFASGVRLMDRNGVLLGVVTGAAQTIAFGSALTNQQHVAEAFDISSLVNTNIASFRAAFVVFSTNATVTTRTSTMWVRETFIGPLK